MSTPSPTTIYLCDDEPASLLLVESWLADHSEFAYAGGGPCDERCLQRITEMRPQIVLLDRHLVGPGTVSDRVAGIRAASAGTLVVLYSGLDEQRLAQEARDSGADGWMTKRDEDWLVGGLRRVLRRARHRAAEGPGPSGRA
jgi:two-component system, NarL family, nitrate/nitrite response regulator NarL